MSRQRRLLTATPLALACLCGAGAAAADDASVAQVPTQRATEIDASTELLYDSNIARVDRALAAQEHLRLADEMFLPDVTGLIARPIGPMMLFLRGDGGYDFHRVNTIRDSGHIDISGGAGRRLASCETSVTGLFGQRQSDLAEIYLINGAQAQTLLKNVETRENVNGSVQCGRSIGLAPSISVTQSWLSNSSTLRRGVDNQALSVNAGLGYRQPAFGVVSLFGVYDTASYPHRSLFYNGPYIPYGYRVMEGGLRYERHIGARLDAQASISYTSLTPTGDTAAFGPAGGSKFGGLTYSLDLTYRVNPRLLIHLNDGRATNASNRIDATYSVDDTYEADATYSMGRRVELKLSVSNRGESYRGLTQASLLPNGQPYNLLKGSTTDVVGSAIYRLNRRFSVALTLGDAERRATPAPFSYSSTTAGLTFRATF